MPASRANPRPTGPGQHSVADLEVAELDDHSTNQEDPDCLDASLTEAIRTVPAASTFLGEGYRKVWANLRFQGIRPPLLERRISAPWPSLHPRLS